MTNPALPQDQWLKMPREELSSLCLSVRVAMVEEKAEPLKCLRHLKNFLLLVQLDGFRGLIEAGTIKPEAATALLRSDFGFGYLFGLAANYVGALCLPQQSAEARTAIFDVHGFTFGDEQKHQIIEEQNARTPSSFGEDYEEGMEAAHRDVNSFKRVFNGAADGPFSTGLVSRLLAVTPLVTRGTRH